MLHLNNSQPQETQQQQQQKETKKRRSVQWTEDTVDNEDLGRLKSNICCIYHKPHAEESESSDTCTSDDEINAIERDKQSKLRHKMKCSKLNKKCC
ncbi:unnamed protein product (macronuclear) [Paramecium tetraurelia]|uniref:Type 1 phosphatases regulator n=1 Tax=Paramecium tetraurelia TaxID=5888 RepID=A0C6D2_PARTE|nr:uncharacterized protein GSPATT00035478001 [Paramecium tetraurelia]CAK66349.1 unnamed protein product [Paramecium tetraurelia]|eukprot:XP_001433746.1 hypothetical protein (macronuclear) [Paramecium tetraurelia strain d4-2]